MKQILQRLAGAWLALLITACTALPELPAIPPGWTLTPSVTSTVTITPIPTATSTPLPIVRVENGDRALFNGDSILALAHYQSAYQDSSDLAVRAAAKWGQIRSLYADSRYSETVDVSNALIGEFPDSVHVPDAFLLQGLAYYEMQDYLDAVAAWQKYLSLRPGVIDAYVQEWSGDALFAAGSYQDALTAYESAIKAPRLDDGIFVDLKVAQTRVNLDEYEAALALYDGIISRTGNDYLKAQAVYLSGKTYQGLGRTEEAFGRYRLAVEDYPLSYYSYLGLVELVDAGVEVSELDRGLVDYHAGQYDVALLAFDRFLEANPINDGTAHYYRALTLRDLGNYQGAVDGLSKFITNYSTHPQWTEAWEEKAYLQWAYLDSYEEAARTLIDYVTVFPSSSSAVDFLMSAGRIRERNGRLDEAAQTWQRAANEYPGSSQASTALFLAGITYYRMGKFEEALEAFNASLSAALAPDEQARAQLWTGKTKLQLGDLEAAKIAWQQAGGIDPGGYYTERARDLMMMAAPFSPPARSNLTYDLAAERSAANTWVRLTFNLPADLNLQGLGSLEQDPRAVRGTALWNIGLLDEAKVEFDALREAVKTNAVDSYRLGNYLLDIGAYRPAIFALRQTLTLAGLDEHAESMMAPVYFSHVRYGLYYPDLIIPNALAEGFDPLFIFSVVRQESLFEGFVRSTAGARGLMQIIPSTGAGIAGILNWPYEYGDEDLYRPDVSIRFGTHYMRTCRDQLGGDLYGALAAYNAGPGNAMVWKEMAGGDPDLFLEVIRFDETRLYIRHIYEIFTIYKRLYGTTP